MRILAALFLLLVFVTPTFAAKYHPPETEAEKVLDKIINADIAQKDVFLNLLKDPKHASPEVRNFETFFTKDFLVAWRNFEKKLVDTYCGGKYLPGKDCGYSLDPISSSVRRSPPYFYLTLIGDNNQSIIMTGSADKEDYDALFYMKRENNAWKIGGLLYEEDTPDTIPSMELIKKFRKPKHESEKMLEETFSAIRHKEWMDSFISNITKESQKIYNSSLFSHALLDSWQKKWKNVYKNSCFTPDACELFPHPLLCTMSYGDDFFIERTTKEDGQQATIVYSYPDGIPQRRFVYHLIKKDSHWLINGVDCGDGVAFGEFSLH